MFNCAIRKIGIDEETFTKDIIEIHGQITQLLLNSNDSSKFVLIINWNIYICWKYTKSMLALLVLMSLKVWS